uniref:MI domain-containing protein n=1 Tax=Lutzomyia longipalpis TaxID=7200 RepID=A0A1B0CR80_LUTLO
MSSGGLGVGASGNGMSGGGSYRNHNGQRNHQNNSSHQNYQTYNNRYNKHNHGNNNSHNSFTSNMLNNKDLAQRFKRNLIQAPQDPVENLQMRPAANSLLFKANINVNKQQLPLTQPRAQTAGGNVGNQFGQNYMGPAESNPPLPQVREQQSYQQSNVKQGMGEKAGHPQVHVSVNPIIMKEDALGKEEPKKQKEKKKDKTPNKEEFIKKVSVFLVETYMPQIEPGENEGSIDDIAMMFIEIKVPEKFMKDAVTIIFTEILEKSDDAHERTIDFLTLLKKEGKLNPNATVEAFQASHKYNE